MISFTDLPLLAATSSADFTEARPFMVALTTFEGLFERSDFVLISLIPATSTTALTGPPAITPVPGAAGIRSTSPAPNLPTISWGDRGALEGNLDKVLLSVLDTLADSVGNFARLAKTKADYAVSVAYYYKRGKLHYTAALYGLGYSIDCNYLLGKLQSCRIY